MDTPNEYAESIRISVYPLRWFNLPQVTLQAGTVTMTLTSWQLEALVCRGERITQYNVEPLSGLISTCLNDQGLELQNISTTERWLVSLDAQTHTELADFTRALCRAATTTEEANLQRAATAEKLGQALKIGRQDGVVRRPDPARVAGVRDQLTEWQRLMRPERLIISIIGARPYDQNHDGGLHDVRGPGECQGQDLWLYVTVEHEEFMFSTPGPFTGRTLMALGSADARASGADWSRPEHWTCTDQPGELKIHLGREASERALEQGQAWEIKDLTLQGAAWLLSR